MSDNFAPQNNLKERGTHWLVLFGLSPAHARTLAARSRRRRSSSSAPPQLSSSPAASQLSSAPQIPSSPLPPQLSSPRSSPPCRRRSSSSAPPQLSSAPAAPQLFLARTTWLGEAVQVGARRRLLLRATAMARRFEICWSKPWWREDKQCTSLWLAVWNSANKCWDTVCCKQQQ